MDTGSELTVGLAGVGLDAYRGQFGGGLLPRPESCRKDAGARLAEPGARVRDAGMAERPEKGAFLLNIPLLRIGH